MVIISLIYLGFALLHSESGLCLNFNETETDDNKRFYFFQSRCTTRFTLFNGLLRKSGIKDADYFSPFSFDSNYLKWTFPRSYSSTESGITIVNRDLEESFALRYYFRSKISHGYDTRYCIKPEEVSHNLFYAKYVDCEATSFDKIKFVKKY